MASEEFPKVGQQLRDLTEKLQKVKKICTKYYEQLRVEQATPKKCKDFRQLTEYLTKIRDDLKNVQEKEASKEITIAFAGATSSGKSSVINALLRERCLPVGCAQTTMCIFKVCLKKDDSDEWSVEIDGKTPKTGKGEKAVNDLLSLMSGSKHRVEREHLKIGTESVVEVNWPLKCKLLPANVVLIDTPGFGEGKKSDKVVTDSCNKADIIVAVMDVMSPSRGTVTKLVKEVNCQFTFGVFTKWDELIERAQHDSNVDVEFLRQEYEERYLKSVDNKGEVYFVSVGCVENKNDEQGTDGFRLFEERLVKSAAKLKDESLIKQALSVILKSKEVFTKFQDILETRKKAQLKRLREREAFLEDDCNAISKICQNVSSSEEIDDIFTEHAIEPLLKKFEDDVKSGRTEEEAQAELLEMVNEKIKKIVDSMSTKARAEFEQWESKIDHFYPIRLNWKLEDEKIPHLESKELPKDLYSCLLDPHAWATNNYVCGIGGTLLIGGTIAVAAVSGLGFALLGGAVAAQTVSFAAAAVGGAVAAGTAVGGVPLTYIGKEVFNVGIGDLIKRKFPISKKKVAAWRRFLLDEFRALHQRCIKVISEETDRIINEAKRVKDDTSKQIVELMDKGSPHNLTKLATDLKESGRNLEEINATFDTMLSELQREESALDCDQTDAWGPIIQII